MIYPISPLELKEVHNEDFPVDAVRVLKEKEVKAYGGGIGRHVSFWRRGRRRPMNSGRTGILRHAQESRVRW
jgi:hypothetical protein